MERINLNDNWLWTPKFEAELCAPKISGAALKKSLQEVRLPHSVAVTPYNYFQPSDYQMVSGYRREFKTERAWKNRRVFVTFLAAAHEASVYLNGKLLGTHSTGYTAFKFELTQALAPAGKNNVLAVKLDSRESLDTPPFGFVVDYMTYGGLYRGAFLEVANENFIEDIFVHTSGTDFCAEISLDKKSEATIRATLFRAAGKDEKGSQDQKGGKDKKSSQDQKSGDSKILFQKEWQTGGGQKIVAQGSLDGAQLWSPETPVLYVLKAELYYGKILVDTKTVRFGFCDIQMKGEGLFLNGKKFLLRGMDRHQSFPYVGYAMPASMQKLDADILKDELGLNAVRTSHYPQSQDFIDHCDERGILVFTEIPGWQHIGKSDKWRKQAVQNVREMVEQYRNHPSIFLWGVRINESPDDDALYAETNALCRALDPTRPTGGVRCIKKSRLLEDVYTFNDFIHEGNNAGCSKKSDVVRAGDAKKPYLISEYAGHMFPTKNFDDEIHRTEHALRHANVINAVAAAKGIAGSFAWCAFDYNTHKDFGSGDFICYHGVMDMFRNPKMAAALYMSQQEKIPVLEISSSMDVGEHPASARGKNWIFTNADSVKMYLGGKFIAEFKKENSPYKNLAHGPILIDDYVGRRLVDEAGLSESASRDLKNILNHVALYGQNSAGLSQMLSFVRLLPRGIGRAKITDYYTKFVGNWGEAAAVFRFEAYKGSKLVKTVFRGPVQSVELCADVSATVLHEDESYDVACVRLSARDNYGNVLPYFFEPASFKASGAIELYGPDQASFRAGSCACYVRTVGKKGKGVLTVSVAGMEKTVGFTVK
ncbi:MAG: glycoside hydrolase family 2 protein [Treponema sp.]|nr:glycoside hydrolase family 2 protein [Treponema sp.]